MRRLKKVFGIAASALALLWLPLGGRVAAQTGQKLNPNTQINWGVPIQSTIVAEGFQSTGGGVVSVAANNTCTADATSAIQAAINLVATQEIVSGVTGSVYIPAGCYLLSTGNLTEAFPVRIFGDGPNATKLYLTNTTANMFTLNGTGGVPCSVFGISDIDCVYSFENMTLAGNGHLQQGTILEMDNIYNWLLTNVAIVNGGGRGFQNNNSERGAGENVQISNTRWPIVYAGSTNETGWYNLRLTNNGVDLGGYSWNVNAVSGVYPAANSAVCANYPAWQASTSYPEGSIICDPNGKLERAMLSGWINVTTKQQTIGVSGGSAPTWPGTFLGTVADNGGGNNHNAITFSSTPTTVGITWQNVGTDFPLVPEKHASFSVFGSVDLSVDQFSIKSLRDQSAFSVINPETIKLTNGYFEAFTSAESYSVGMNHAIDDFVLSSGLGSTATVAPVTNSIWAPNYYTNPATAATLGGSQMQFKIVCSDYNPLSTSASSCGGGLLQDQFEVATVRGFSSDGNAYFLSRNNSGSTAPSSFAWANNSRMFLYSLSQHGGVTSINNHYGPGVTVNQSAGYTCACGDLLTNGLSGDILSGPAFNADFPIGSANSLAPGAFTSIADSAFNDTSGNYESIGSGTLKSAFNLLATILPSPNFMNTTPLTTQTALLQNVQSGASVLMNAIYTPSGPPLFVLAGSDAQIRTDTGVASAPSGYGVFGGSTYGSHVDFLGNYCFDPMALPGVPADYEACWLDSAAGTGFSIQGSNGTGFKDLLYLEVTGAGTTGVSMSETINGGVNYALDGGSANAYTAPLAVPLTSYVAGLRVIVLIGHTNTGASTLNVTGLGAKNILSRSTTGLTTLVAGDLVAGQIATFDYDGTQFETGGVVSGGSTGGSGTANTLAMFTSSSTVSNSPITISGGELYASDLFNLTIGHATGTVPEANVLYYGADPTGVADSTVSINNCLAATYASVVRTCYLPAGTYHVTNSITPGLYQTVRGDGWDSIIDVSTDFNPSATGVIVPATGFNPNAQTGIKDLSIVFHQAPDTTTTTTAASAATATTITVASVPGNLAVGDFVIDTTNLTAIVPAVGTTMAATTVTSITGLVIGLSNPVASPGVSNGDTK